MATKETSVMDELRDLTECSICNRMISDPRGLPCIHTFCLECLEKFESSSHKKPDDKMLCPVCRKEFTIPPDGMNGLQKNFFVERLAELMKISKPIGNVTGCDACKAYNDSTEMEAEATEYCIQCREKLCRSCSMEHLRNKFSRNHQVVQMGCDVTEILAEKHYSSACDLHPEKKTEMYCVECKVVICMMCFAESHNTHKCMDVRKAEEKFQKDIENDIKKLIEFPRETQDKLEQMEQEKKEFLKELQDTERTIKSKCKELKGVADKHANDLLEELSSVEQNRFKVMDSRKEEVERHLDSIDRFNTYSKEIISRGSPSDVCRAVNDLHVRAEELQALHEIHIRQRNPSVNVSFKETEMQGLLRGNNVIGNITEEEIRAVGLCNIWKETKSNVLMKPRTVTIWSTVLVFILAVVLFRGVPNSNVNPVAILNTSSCDRVLSVSLSQNAINILCGNPKHIFIHDCQYPFSLLTLLELEYMMEKPDNLMSSSTSDDLYISDEGNDCIRLSSQNLHNYYYRRNLIGNDDFWMQSLSRDEAAIVGANRGLWMLKLYSIENKKIFHSFQLPDDTYSQHAVMTSTNEFVVSYAPFHNNSKGVYKVDKNGHIIERYNPTNRLQELGFPIYLSLTSDEQVIVADTQNDRILLLNSDLSWNRVLLTGDDDVGIMKPKMICYDNDKQLFIVANEEGRVTVYNSTSIGLHLDVNN